MQAIETQYKGYRFRSRLEARWAVLFDAAGIEWNYEDQGYRVKDWFNPMRETLNYLPDFYIPKRDVFVEVKGDPSEFDIQNLVSAAIPHEGLPHKSNDTSRLGDRILIVGQIPLAGYCPHGVMLHWWKGDVYAPLWTLDYGTIHDDMLEHRIGGDNGDVTVDELFRVTAILRSKIHVWSSKRFSNECADAARTARFEHGEIPRVAGFHRR